MDKCKNIKAFLTIGILGTLSHFVYEWTGEPVCIGIFFPVNESIWEHLKLLFYPAAIYFTIEYFYCKGKAKNFICTSILSIFIGMITIIVLFYTYNGAIGINLDLLNILIYYSAVATMLISRKILLKNKKKNIKIYNITTIILFIIMMILFAIFSFNPPALGIFQIP